MQMTLITPAVLAELVSKMSLQDLGVFAETLYKTDSYKSALLSRELEILEMDDHYTKCEISA